MRHPDPAVFEHHLVPLLDIGYHVFDEDCLCGTWSDCPGSVIHQAWDGRQEEISNEEHRRSI
jgi:hypothetical protein